MTRSLLHLFLVLLAAPAAAPGQNPSDAAWRQSQVDALVNKISLDLRPGQENYPEVEKRIRELGSFHGLKIRDPFTARIRDCQAWQSRMAEIRRSCLAITTGVSLEKKDEHAGYANILLKQHFKVKHGLVETGSADARNAEALRWAAQMEKRLDQETKRLAKLQELHGRFLGVLAGTKMRIDIQAEYNGAFTMRRVVVNGIVADAPAGKCRLWFKIAGTTDAHPERAAITDGGLSWGVDDAMQIVPLEGTYNLAAKVIELHVVGPIEINKANAPKEGARLSKQDVEKLRRALDIRGTLDGDASLNAKGTWRLTLQKFGLGAFGNEGFTCDVTAEGSWTASPDLPADEPPKEP